MGRFTPTGFDADHCEAGNQYQKAEYQKLNLLQDPGNVEVNMYKERDPEVGEITWLETWKKHINVTCNHLLKCHSPRTRLSYTS